jgi:hypothetical protein
LFDLGPSHRRYPGCIIPTGYCIVITQGTLIQRCERKVAGSAIARRAAMRHSLPLEFERLWVPEKSEVL